MAERLPRRRARSGETDGWIRAERQPPQSAAPSASEPIAQRPALRALRCHAEREPGYVGVGILDAVACCGLQSVDRPHGEGHGRHASRSLSRQRVTPRAPDVAAHIGIKGSRGVTPGSHRDTRSAEMVDAVTGGQEIGSSNLPVPTNLAAAFSVTVFPSGAKWILMIINTSRRVRLTLMAPWRYVAE